MLSAVLAIGIRSAGADAAPATAPAKPAASTLSQAMKLVIAGDQSGAEHLLERSIGAAVDSGDSPDVEEVFLAAVLTRSRFQIEEAAPAFDYVRRASPETSHGQAANYILLLDQRAPRLERNFRLLQELADRKPADPLLLWMLGVQCRSLERNEIGVVAYAQLCKAWDPGPVLVHQTYANLLDALARYEESLVHRQLAVKLDPKAWSYDGLGNTLTALKRWKEADEAYARATEMAPDRSRYWLNWSISLRARGDAAGAARLAEKAENARKRAGE